MSVPTIPGSPQTRRRLFRMYGLPNAAPTPAQWERTKDSLALFCKDVRVLFVDDFNHWRPVVYCAPDLPVHLL